MPKKKKESFQQEWVKKTYTGRALDKVTGGKLSGKGKKKSGW